jgi:hypothetical protein
LSLPPWTTKKGDLYSAKVYGVLACAYSNVWIVFNLSLSFWYRGSVLCDSIAAGFLQFLLRSILKILVSLGRNHPTS